MPQPATRLTVPSLRSITLVCFSICIVAVLSAGLGGILVIWFEESRNVGYKTFLSAGTIFASSLAILAVSKAFLTFLENDGSLTRVRTTSPDDPANLAPNPDDTTP